ncbi:hypothetical protein MD484_g6400, partial [Candolleomyces efflorescens]
MPLYNRAEPHTYSRTALGALGYALTILRLFDSQFHRTNRYTYLYHFFRSSISRTLHQPSYLERNYPLAVGLLFAILGALLFIIAFFRARISTHDFADRHKEAVLIDRAVQTVGQSRNRIFGRPFVTAGWSVLQVAAVVGAVEVALLVLILKYDPSR